MGRRRKSPLSKGVEGQRKALLLVGVVSERIGSLRLHNILFYVGSHGVGDIMYILENQAVLHGALKLFLEVVDALSPQVRASRMNVEDQ